MIAIYPCLAVLLANSTAPIEVKVGDLDSSRLQPYESMWRIVEVSAAGVSREVMQHTDRLESAVINGQAVWRQVQGDIAVGQPGGSFVGTSDRRTFRPIESIERGPDGAFRHLRYAPDAVLLECRGDRCPPDLRDGKTNAKRVATAQSTFDYWGGTYGLLFASLPLEVGKSFVLPVFHPARGLINLRVDVEKMERIAAADGTEFEAFKLRVPLNNWVYHLSPRPPYWVRLEYARPDGSRQITERLSATTTEVLRNDS